MTRPENTGNVEEQIQKTLRCLDEVEKAKASPFFAQRLRQRLADMDGQGRRGSLADLLMGWLRPAFVPALVAASVVLGVLIGSDTSSGSRAGNLQSFVSSYGLDAPETNDYFLTHGE